MSAGGSVAAPSGAALSVAAASAGAPSPASLAPAAAWRHRGGSGSLPGRRLRDALGLGLGQRRAAHGYSEPDRHEHEGERVRPGSGMKVTNHTALSLRSFVQQRAQLLQVQRIFLAAVVAMHVAHDRRRGR